MTLKKLTSIAFIAALLFGSASCKKDEKEPEAPPAPVNQLTFNGQSKTLSHAYAISYEDDLFIDGTAYRYFELVLSTRDIGVFYLENEGTFDLEALTSPIYGNAGDSYVVIPFGVKESVFSSIEGDYNSLNSNSAPNRLLSSDATLLWNYTPSITSFANSLTEVSADVNSLLSVVFRGAIGDNLRQNIAILGFLSYNGLSAPVSYEFTGSMQYYITNVDPNSLFTLERLPSQLVKK